MDNQAPKEKRLVTKLFIFRTGKKERMPLRRHRRHQPEKKEGMRTANFSCGSLNGKRKKKRSHFLDVSKIEQRKGEDHREKRFLRRARQ